MSRELVLFLVRPCLDVDKEDAQRVVCGDLLPLDHLLAQLLDHPHDELLLLLVDGEDVGGEEEETEVDRHQTNT